MVELYVNRILDGKMTLEGVKERWRSEVAKELKARGK